MKKTTLKTLLFLTFGLISFGINAQTIYYEDFRYENEGRGFTVQKVALDGQVAGAVGKRVGDVVDAADSDPVFDESSRPTERIPNGTTRQQRAIAFKNTTGEAATENTASTLANHEIEAWALMTNQDLSTTNMAKVTFWTEQRSVVGNGATISIMVSQDYTHGSLPNTATWTDETANITGAIASSNTTNETYVKGELDLSAYTGTSVTIAFKVVTDNTAYAAGVSQHGTFYISDVKFEAAREEVANGAFSALNTSATGQIGIFNTPYASMAESNFSNLKWADVLTTEGSVPRLANGLLIPIGEGYQFEVADKYDAIAVSEVRYVVVNGASNKGAPDNSKWMVQGSTDNANWDTLKEPIEMFSASNDIETAVSLSTAKAYRYYRFVLATAWTPNSNFTALKQLDFTVDSSVLSVDRNTISDSFKVYPNPTSDFINITATDVAIKNVKLINLIGKVIYNSKSAKTIDVRNFAKGLYILKIESNKGGVFSKKVILK